MELVKGQPITQYCDQHRLTPKERLELFVPVCQAIQHAHQKGIIHRDIKPSNVLVGLYDGRPVPKVIDFGVAKAAGPKLTEKTLYTEFGQVVGTLEYMSPEQAQLDNLDIDTRSDIYSLGVLLYELLTGTTPLQRQRLKQAALLEVLRLIREEEPPRPSTRLSTTEELPSIAANRGLEPRKLSGLVRGELDWIVMKALEKDRNRRYETANGLAHDIERHLRDEPVLACPPSARYRMRKFARRNKTMLAVVCLVLFFIALLGGGAGWVMREKTARQEALDQQVREILEEADDLIKTDKWPEALAPVERAEKLLAAGGRSERPPRLGELREELIMAARLEGIYRGSKQGQKTQGNTASRDGAEQAFPMQLRRIKEDAYYCRQKDAEFAQAFQDFGIDIEALGSTEAAAQITPRAIHSVLVKALDEWASLRKRARGDNDVSWKKLVETARQADPDDWRNRCRDAFLRGDRQALEQLADTVPIGQMPPASLYLLGHTLSDVSAVDKTMDLLRRAQHEYPSDLWINDTLAYFSANVCQPPRWDDAVRFYTAVLALRPGFAPLHRSVADVFRAKGALQEALAEYTKAVELDPNDRLGWLSRGWLYQYSLHSHDKAVADYTRVIELNPKEIQALLDRAGSYAALGQKDKALADWSKITEREPDDPWDWWNRGTAHLVLHQYDKAVADFSKGIEVAPERWGYWSGRGSAYVELRQYDKALDDFSKVIEKEPKDRYAWFKRAGVNNQLGRYAETLADYQKVLELDKDSASAHNNLAWFLATCPDVKYRDPARAVDLAKKAVELAPKEGGPWNTLGVAHYRAGDWKAAIDALDKSREYGKGGVAFDFFLLAMSNWQLGQKDDARNWYKQAVEWVEKNKDALAKHPEWTEELRRFRAEAKELLNMKE
jgi:tetratricopeptide (TPR) repeat protein